MSVRHQRRTTLPLRILLVDDNEGEYLLVRDLLRRFTGRSIALDWVTSSQEALRSFREVGAYDLYLIDYKLLDHTGLDVVKDLRAGGCRAPLLMLTTLADDAVDRQAMRAGAADYLIKSELNRPLLQRAIRHALERNEMAKALRESEERYRSLAQNFPNGCIIVMDHEGRIVLAEGSSLQDLFAESSVSSESLPGRMVRDLFTDSFGEHILEEATRTLSGKKSTTETDHRGRRWLVSVAPQARFDAPPHAVIVLKDVSSRRIGEQIAMERNALMRLLQSCAAMKSNNTLPTELQESYVAATQVVRQDDLKT